MQNAFLSGTGPKLLLEKARIEVGSTTTSSVSDVLSRYRRANDVGVKDTVRAAKEKQEEGINEDKEKEKEENKKKHGKKILLDSENNSMDSKIKAAKLAQTKEKEEQMKLRRRKKKKMSRLQNGNKSGKGKKFKSILESVDNSKQSFQKKTKKIWDDFNLSLFRKVPSFL